MNSFITSHGQDKLINYIERDLNSFKHLKNLDSTLYHECLPIINILTDWLNQLTATLNCYTSLLNENIIDIKLLKSHHSR